MVNLIIRVNKMTKTIIFDFDGTLANTRQVLLKVYPRVARKYNFKILPEEELEKLKSLSFRERFKKVDMPIAKLPAIIRETRALCSEYMDLCEPYPGIPETVYSLADRGYFLAIISSNIEDNIKQFLTSQNMEVFDSIFTTSGFFGKHTVLAKFLKKQGINKDNVIYVGDEVRDIVSCRKVGIKVISVTWGYDDVSILEQAGPDYLVNEPAEILNYF